MATIAIQKRMNKQMTELQVKSDHHTRQMIMERKRLDDLDEALKQAEEQIKNFRLSTKKSAVDLLNQHRFTAQPRNLRTDAVDPSKLAEISRNKLIASLENRLNNMQIRQSLTETANEKMKTSINTLRRHRMTSNKSHLAMEYGIRETQRKVRDVLERSQEVSESRERGVFALQESKRQQQEERDRFTEQMASLAEYVERQNALFEESLMASAATTAPRFRKAPHSEEEEEEVLPTRGDLTIAEEKVRTSMVEDLEKQIEGEEGAMIVTQERIALFKRSFDELKRVSGIQDLGEIVRRYVASEEETFSLFNYVQALNQETDWTLERHKRLEEEIKSYEDKLAEEEAYRAEAMAELQEKWRSAKEATDECANAATEAQRTLERIAKKIQSLFFKIQCDQVVSTNPPVKKNNKENAAAAGQQPPKGESKSPTSSGTPTAPPSSDNTTAQPAVAAEGQNGKQKAINNGDRQQDSRLALLTGQGVTESNIVAYAELIEHRALEIMSEYVRKTHAQEQRRVTPVLEPSRSLLDPAQGAEHIKPPEIDTFFLADDDELDDDFDGRPIRLEEMRRRTAEKLTKKQQISVQKTTTAKGGGGGRTPGGKNNNHHNRQAHFTRS